MRIAVVTESFYPATDGTTTTVRNLLDGLVDRGHTVRLVAPAPGLTSYRNVEIVRVRALDKPGRQVRAALEGFAPDLVHVTSSVEIGPTLGRKALKHARRLDVPTVAVQQVGVSDLAAPLWTTKVAERADRVLVTARWMVERLAGLGVDAPLWAPGVDTDAFSPALRDDWLHDRWARARSRGGPRTVVGYVGALEKHQGVRRLPEVAAVPGVRLVVVGAGSQHDWLAHRLGSLTGPGAKLAGPLAAGDLATAMASLDVLVHPGTGLTCAHALREAHAAGVPVVAARTGGARDVVEHLESGLLFDPTDPRGLVRAVEALAADRHRGLMGEHGRRAAGARSWSDAVAELVDTHYAAVLGRGALRIAG
ncbi:glycosyltransferase [Nocardioides zeae]|uniref:Glycosyltransferase n=1 Tax=Nocardioides imazamoxiresistens TaxID=3231893 RepID=A0ABU3PU99_9ACTN|nr:glycosyltransferase [Nocardioides zeae]MDT9592759.1 glycosyltransferase [Nocardioides zeae]